MSCRIEVVKGIAVLPTGGCPWNFAEWDNARDKIEEFKLRAVGRNLEEGERVRVELALIHRPDNEHNSNAISVAAPDHYGGNRNQRLFGYLYESQLRRIGKTLLADLVIALDGAELRCTGIATRDGLELDLPYPVELIMAIDRFLATGSAERPGRQRQPEGEGERVYTCQ